MSVTEALKVYPVYQKIIAHFADHQILTDEDFERLQGEEYQKVVRRSLPEIEGEADLVIFDSVDLP